MYSTSTSRSTKKSTDPICNEEIDKSKDHGKYLKFLAVSDFGSSFGGIILSLLCAWFTLLNIFYGFGG